MTGRVASIVSGAVLQLLAVVLAHELTYLARYGSRYNEALVHAGHGESWGAAVTTSLVLGATLLAVGVLRLARLGLLARRQEALRCRGGAELEPRALVHAWARTATVVALLTVVLLTIQENLERGGAGEGMPGVGLLLSPEYAGGLWIAIAVGLAVGLVAALFEWRHRALLARLRGARASLPRGTNNAVPGTGVVASRAIESLLGRRSALRAPPQRSAV